MLQGEIVATRLPDDLVNVGEGFLCFKFVKFKFI